jgi:hypothetical protein
MAFQGPTNASTPLHLGHNVPQDWVTAVHLVVSAAQLAGDSQASPVAVRKRHIDAITYMNHALPRDLTDAEIRSIQDSLPAQVREYEPRTLRRAISIITFRLVAFTIFLVPVISNFLDQLRRLDDEYQIHQQIWRHGQRSMRKIGGGRFIVRLMALMSWLNDVFCGGVYDGVNRSLQPRAPLL